MQFLVICECLHKIQLNIYIEKCILLFTHRYRPVNDAIFILDFRKHITIIRSILTFSHSIYSSGKLENMTFKQNRMCNIYLNKFIRNIHLIITSTQNISNIYFCNVQCHSIYTRNFISSFFISMIQNDIWQKREYFVCEKSSENNIYVDVLATWNMSF